jgi:NADP-dependent 3-hydroxy acid dehydrogenase YdfG
VELDEKVALVTGAGAGIGRATALRRVQTGIVIPLSFRRPSRRSALLVLLGCTGEAPAGMAATAEMRL